MSQSEFSEHPSLDNQFPPNNGKAPKREKKGARVEPEKRIEKVVTTPAVRRKKPIGRRILDTFGGGDARNVWEFVALDVLLPAAKNMIADAVSQGVEQMIFGEVRSVSRRDGRRPGTYRGDNYTPYNRVGTSSYRRPDPRDRDRDSGPSISRRARSVHDFGEIILATRVEAEEVLSRLYDTVERYDAATVSDLYEMVGISGDFTDEKWGWTDLRGSDILRRREGYILILPRPEALD